MAGLPVLGAWIVHPDGLSVDDLANSEAPEAILVNALVHSPKKTGVGPPQAVGPKLQLEPYTAEACLIEGVDPRDLYQRSLETFTWGERTDRAMAQMRCDLYNKLREEKVSLVTTTRAALLRGELPPSLGVTASERVGVLNSTSKGPAPVPRSTTALEREAIRLARIQERQQRELAQLVASEVRLLDTMETAARRGQEDDGRVEERSAHLAAKKKAEAEDRRMREMKKQLMEKEAEKRMREMTAESRRKDEAARALEAARKDAIAREKLEKELQRSQKLSELERERRRKEAEVAEGVLQRQEEMAMAEADRQEMMRRRDEARGAAAAEKKRAAEERIAANMEASRRQEAERKADMDRRAALAEERRAATEAKRKAEIQAKAMEHALEMKRREMTSRQAAKDEDTRKTLLELRLAAEAEEQQRMRHEQERVSRLMHEKSTIEEAAKHDAVERAKAKDDYRRLVIMRTIEDKLARGEERARAKAEAARVRREMSAKSLQQKHRVLTAMSNMRSPWDLQSVQNELLSVMESGVTDVVSGTLGPALKAAREELKAGRLGTGQGSPSHTSSPSRQRGSPPRPLTGFSSASSTFYAQQQQQQQQQQYPPGTAHSFNPQGVQLSLEALDAIRQPAPPPDAYSFLVEPPRRTGADFLAGGAGLMWSGSATAAAAGSTPGGANVPTGLFFQTGPAMQALLAQRVNTAGTGAATPAVALGLGYGGGGGGAPSMEGSGQIRGFQSYTGVKGGQLAPNSSTYSTTPSR